MTCPVCGSLAFSAALDAREMMIGLRDPFQYLGCARCGALHLGDVPEDLSPYYPQGYYSFDGRPQDTQGARRALKLARTRVLLAAPAFATATRRFGQPAWARWFRSMRLGRGSRILDVGCGWGENLAYLQRDGFTALAGVDAYLPERELDHGSGLLVRRAELRDVESGWDLVMLHHSFEHMADPHAVLHDLRRVLRPGGWALIRTPIADSWAARTYGADWAALDAPRHLVIHTRRSMEILAQAAGFGLVDQFWDSWSFQLWGSEQYRAGIALQDPRSHAVDPQASMFTAVQVREFERRADALNRTGEGDQAGFVLQAR